MMIVVVNYGGFSIFVVAAAAAQHRFSIKKKVFVSRNSLGLWFEC